MGGVIKMIGGLTNKGDGQGGSEGFMQLLQGAGGSGGKKTRQNCDISRQPIHSK